MRPVPAARLLVVALIVTTIDPAETRSAIDQDTAHARLAPGATLTRDIAGGERHSYQMALTAGHFLQVAVTQLRIDVSVSLRCRR